VPTLPRIDFHAHLASIAPVPQVAGVIEDEKGRLSVDGDIIGMSGLYEPEALLEYMDRRCLDLAIVSPPPPLFRQQLELDAAAEWVGALNAGMIERIEPHGRLLPLAYLPLEHPQLAIHEQSRRRVDAKWVGFCASAGGGSVSLASADLIPLWEALDAGGDLLLLHPGTSPDARLNEFYLTNLLGNPIETAVAAAQLVFADVLSSYPRMRVLLVHCGGCVPDVVARWDRGVATQRPGLQALSESPSRAVRRFYVDCLAHEAGAVERAIDVFGEDKLVLGSDWPFPMGTDDPCGLIAHRGEAFVERVARVNAQAALRSSERAWPTRPRQER
jgi:aminocarboxymuconate-semialdehyde decarboxylase